MLPPIVFCLICMLCLTFVSCEPRQNVVAVVPGQADAVQLPTYDNDADLLAEPAELSPDGLSCRLDDVRRGAGESLPSLREIQQTTENNSAVPQEPPFAPGDGLYSLFGVCFKVQVNGQVVCTKRAMRRSSMQRQNPPGPWALDAKPLHPVSRSKYQPRPAVELDVLDTSLAQVQFPQPPGSTHSMGSPRDSMVRMCSGLDTSEYEAKVIEDRKETVRPPVEPQVSSLGQISATNDTQLAPAEKTTLENHPVNLPALDKPGMADEFVSVNFDRVDIRTLLKTVGDITGINFIVDDSVRGTVSVMSPTKIPLGQIYEFLESILEVKGCAAVPAAGNLVKIIPRAEAAKHNLQVRIGSNPSEIPQTDTLVTQIIPLVYADATEISNIVGSLSSTGSYMATYPRTNSILITDTSSNIHHIAKIIQQLDVIGSKEEVTIIPLQYASARVLSEQITGIIQKGRVGAIPASRIRRPTQVDTGMKILPDERTNSLIIVANAQDTDMIRTLAEQLDIERPRGANNIHVVYLKNAPAVDTAKSLTAALADLKVTGALEPTQRVQVTADEGTGALIITAAPQDFEVISEIVEKLDIVREQVLVEMLIMEVSEDVLEQIGIDWASVDQSVEGSTRVFGATNLGPTVDFLSGNLEGLAVGAWRGAADNLRIGALLHALQKQSGVNILSTPHILTSNHNQAKIIVGENIPYVMQSRITETTDFITPTVIKTYEYKDVGISLEITPHISQGGLVRLEINSEFTKLVEAVTTSSTDTPTTAKRQAQTVVSMDSGSTVVIGGLIRDDKVTLDKKIPLAGDLPLVGSLFRYQKDRLQKTNLIIFITPHVLSSQDDLDHITDKKKQQIKPAIEELEKEGQEQ